mmetsp:Transcript_3986/g.12482  ORF Transcript_3986/g.12482 Transcript_3986/m.12482 type:complete len:209 (-) Transcript_3986:2018-2644(-)
MMATVFSASMNFSRSVRLSNLSPPSASSARCMGLKVSSAWRTMRVLRPVISATSDEPPHRSISSSTGLAGRFSASMPRNKRLLISTSLSSLTRPSRPSSSSTLSSPSSSSSSCSSSLSGRAFFALRPLAAVPLPLPLAAPTLGLTSRGLDGTVAPLANGSKTMSLSLSLSISPPSSSPDRRLRPTCGLLSPAPSESESTSRAGGAPAA